MERLWKRWRGAAVRGEGGGGDGRASLDAWQGFAHDIVEKKRLERGMSQRERLAKTGRSEYAPLRMFWTGKAGAGKSKTVRAIAVAQRRAAEKDLEQEAAAAARARRGFREEVEREGVGEGVRRRSRCGGRRWPRRRGRDGSGRRWRI